MSTVILLGLEEVLEEAGWDQPAMFYAITGTEAEPTFAPLAESPGHPCHALQGLWNAGVRVPDKSIGLAWTVEGWRHLTLPELEEQEPGEYASLLEEVVEEHQGDVDEMQTAVQRGWDAFCLSNSPTSMPETLRIQVRNSVVVLSTGWTLMVIRDRGGQPETQPPVSPKRLKEARVPDFMHMFLTGTAPVD